MFLFKDIFKMFCKDHRKEMHMWIINYDILPYYICNNIPYVTDGIVRMVILVCI